MFYPLSKAYFNNAYRSIYIHIRNYPGVVGTVLDNPRDDGLVTLPGVQAEICRCGRLFGNDPYFLFPSEGMADPVLAAQHKPISFHNHRV